jgi:TonB family protein
MNNRMIWRPAEKGSFLPESGITSSNAKSGARWLPFRAARLALLLGAFAAAAAGQESRKTLSAPAPVYPQLARQLQLKGTVKIQIAVRKDGTVEDASVVGGHPILVEAALEAVKRWKYEPAAGETTLVVQFNFHP